MTTSPGPPTARTRVRRHPERGEYDRAAIDDVLDAGYLCHAAVTEDGYPRIVPLIYGRWRDRIVLHGALANQMLAKGADSEVCVTVTVVDELVLARSTMHHSINYRSVVVFGVLEEITDPDDKREALTAVVEHALPGRTEVARGPNDAELRATRVASLALTEASAKIRTGPPADDPIDDGLAVWSGTVPVHTVAGAPTAAPDVTAGVATPPFLSVRGTRQQG